MADEKLSLLKRALHEIQTLKKNADQNQNKEAIAIIGTACRFPGGSTSPERFWEFLKQGGDGITEMPAKRFDIEAMYNPDTSVPGKTYVKEGGFLQEDISLFDANFFKVSPREAMDMDPQQRVLLELSFEVLERASIPPNQLKNSQTGVFIGQIGSEYGFFHAQPLEALGPYAITGMLPNMTSGRIAHHFGFQGPAITVDTACSSSLVSVHLACNSLHNKECDLALAGGVSFMISPDVFVMLSKVHALAKDGRCKSFDASADGYGRGEGAAVLLLKRMSDAVRDKDLILGEIMGSAINQDGPSSGLTVPNGLAQEKVMRVALNRAGISPEAVDYFEAHGTGTSLGDPIEMHSINTEFGKQMRKNPLYIGTVKSNIGHLEAAAGVAGIMKILLSLAHKTILPNIHLKKLNPRIDLSVIPAIIPLQAIPWEQKSTKRIACMNSFGFSGTNAHMIFSESTQVFSASAVKNEHVLVLSALNKQALNQMAENFHQFLQDQGEQYDIGDICFSANTGRQHFVQRLAITGTNRSDLIQGLKHYLEHIPDARVIDEPMKDPVIPEDTSGYALDALARLYCSGVDIDWNTVYPKEDFHKVILPTYPFQRQSFWTMPSEKDEISHGVALSKNPLSGITFSSPMEQKQFSFSISTENLPELKDTHNLMHVGYFMQMIALNLNLKNFTLIYIEFISAITFVKGKKKLISMIVSPDEDRLDLQFFTQDDVSSQWILHVKAQVKPEIENMPDAWESIANIQNRCMVRYGSQEFYDGLRTRGVTLALGESVRWIDAVWANKGEALARFKPKPCAPGIWDACAQLFHAALMDEDSMYMVHRWEQVLIKKLPETPKEYWCHLKLKPLSNPKILGGTFTMFDAEGEVFIQCTDFEMYAVNQKWMEAFLKHDEAKKPGERSVFLKQLGMLTPEEQIERLCGYLIDSYSRLLAIPAKTLDAQSSLHEIGADSIINLTLKEEVYAKTGMNIPIAWLMEDTNIEKIAKAMTSLIAEQNNSADKTIQSAEDKSSLWFTKSPKDPQKIQLFCFPYGGGAASLYKGWQEKMPEHIRVIPVQLPGRENRFEEEPFTSIYPLIDTLGAIIGPECDTPFAFYGHSAGALIAYRLMKRLTENPAYEKNSRQLFVAAYSAPKVHPNPWYQQFVLKLQGAGFQGVPGLTELQQSSADQLAVFMELMELEINLEQYAEKESDISFIKLILSKLMADLQLVESYQHKDNEYPLGVPITAFHGDEDERVSAQDMQAWESFTTADFNYVNLPGDHFFLHKDQSQDLLINAIVEVLSKGF